jgi:MoxR-like ATPase
MTVKEKFKALFTRSNKGIYEKEPVKEKIKVLPTDLNKGVYEKEPVKERIQALLTDLNKGIYEKEEIMALALLSSIAGESIFLLGPPGVAKSLIARRLKYAYKGGSAFEYLMSRFSTPDEIFGPVSISKLKNEDKYERITENYLPSATVVFLDEIWKAGPSIQNALLTVLNEKKFRNGEKEIDLPMKALISASNELPAKDEGLEALWDRFLVRLVVEGIEDEWNFEMMIAEDLHSYDDTVAPEHKIADKEYEDWDTAIKEIMIPENVFNVIHVIRRKIAEHNQKDGNKDSPIYISDRRWRKIIRLLRTSAFLNDREEVDLMDCFLIQHCLWNEKTERDAVDNFVQDAIGEHGYTFTLDFTDMLQELYEFTTEIDKETKIVTDTRVSYYSTTEGHYELEKPLSEYSRYIKVGDFEKLGKDEQTVALYIKQNQTFHSQQNFQIKKGKDSVHISIGNKNYKLKTFVKGDKRLKTRKPNEKLEKIWDGEVDEFLQHTNEWKEQIESYRNKDLEHLRTNLFVDPRRAYIVEDHITETIKEIEKIEVNIRAIQNGYKKLEEKDVVLND